MGGMVRGRGEVGDEGGEGEGRRERFFMLSTWREGVHVLDEDGSEGKGEEKNEKGERRSRRGTRRRTRIGVRGSQQKIHHLHDEHKSICVTHLVETLKPNCFLRHHHHLQ